MVVICAIVLVGILGWAVDSERAARDFALLMRRLTAAPSNASVQHAILAAIHRSRFAHVSEAASQKVYRIALHALAENSLPSTRTFALEIGRWHFGRCRPDKKPSSHDEQAIQKEVLVRCQ